jgi:hypothetical protein
MFSRRFGTRPDEILFRAGTGAFALLLIAVVVAIGFELYRQSLLSIKEFGWQFWQTDIWDPVAGHRRAPVYLGLDSFVGRGTPDFDPDCARHCHLPLRVGTDLAPASARVPDGAARRDPQSCMGWGIFVLVPSCGSCRLQRPSG